MQGWAVEMLNHPEGDSAKDNTLRAWSHYVCVTSRDEVCHVTSRGDLV